MLKTRKSYQSQEVRRLRESLVAERLRWLINFAQQRSERFTTRSARKVIGQLGASLTEVVLQREATGDVVDLRHPELADLPMRGADDQKSLTEKLGLVQSTILTLLTQHLSEGGQRPEARIILRLTADGDGYVSRQYETDDIRDAAAYVVLLEIGKFAGRLRCCAAHNCGRIFVRERRQRYCSVACRNRATFQRWYRRHRKTRRARSSTPVQQARRRYTQQKMRTHRAAARA